MPAIIAKSISILSDAGLGMAMFSLGKALLNIHFLLFRKEGKQKEKAKQSIKLAKVCKFLSFSGF